MEESEDTNPVKKHPSLPPNYVTLAMLKERWLLKKKEEEEEKLKQQQNLQREAKEEIASGSKRGIATTARNQNRQESRPAFVRRRRQQHLKDRRGAGGWVKKYEEPESSRSIVSGGNLEMEKKKEKKYQKGSKPRVLENVKSPENVAGKEEIPMVVSEESGGKGQFCGELQLGGDNGGVEGGVSVYTVEVVSENGIERDIQKVSGGERRGGKERRAGFRRNENRRMNFKVHKQVGEPGGKEKKAEEGIVRVAKERRENGEMGRQSGTGCWAVKIDKSFQDLLLDDGKDANVRMRVSDSGGQQENTQRMNFKVGKQVGELGDMEKKVEEGVVGLANDSRKNGDEGRVRTGTGSWAMNIEKRFRNLSLDNRKYGNVRMRISGSGGGRQGYIGYRRVPRERVEQVENRLMWVKKGESSGGNVTEFNSQQIKGERKTFALPMEIQGIRFIREGQ